jgi:hypothetical protein
MAVTLTSALTNTRSLLDEPSNSNSPFWTDAELTVWLNEGCVELQRRCEWKQDVVTIPVTVDTQFYAAPQNIMRIHRVTFVQNYPGSTESPNTYTLEYRGFMEMDQLWGINQQWPASYPLYYTLWGNPGAANSTLQLILYPVPSQSGNLFVYTYPNIIPVSTSNESANIDAPNGFEDVVYNYASYRALLKDADPRWQQFKSLYEDGVVMVTNSTTDYQDQANFVSTGQVALPAWLINNDMGW